MIEREGIGPSGQQEAARIINREFRKHLFELFFGWIYRPFTDRLFQLRQRLKYGSGWQHKGQMIDYAGGFPTTEDRPWWSLANHDHSSVWRPSWKILLDELLDKRRIRRGEDLGDRPPGFRREGESRWRLRP